MLISTHFPCADVRGFLDEGARLPLPYWRNPEVDREFVRDFGAIRVRVAGGASLFSGEDRTCRADNALRFPKWPSGAPRLRCVFRGFFADGDALAKFDVGVATRGSPPAPRTAEAELRRVLDLPTTIPHGGRAGPSTDIPLGQAGNPLARAYLRASTRADAGVEPADWWVRATSPVTTLQYNEPDRIELPADVTRVEASAGSGGVTLAHWWMPYAGTRRRVWFLGYQDVRDYPLARQLRIDLVRLHCERECLGTVLRCVATGKLAPKPRTPASDSLQRYLSDTITRITRLSTDRKDAVAAGVVAIATAADEQAAAENAALRRDMQEQLRKLDLRPNVRRRVEAVEDLAFGGLGDVDLATLGPAELRDLLGERFSIAGLGMLCTRMTELLRREHMLDEARTFTLDDVGGDTRAEIADRLVGLVHRNGWDDILVRAIRLEGERA